MTRKDYILIAEALRDTRSIALAGPGFAHTPNPDEARGIDNVAAVLACRLQDDNPNFSREHFLAVVRGEKELNSRPSRKNTEPDSLYGKRCVRCGAHFYRNGACECLR